MEKCWGKKHVNNMKQYETYDIFISQIWDSSDFSASNSGIFQHQTSGSNHSISDHLAGDGLEVKGVEHRVERPRSLGVRLVSTASLQELTASPNINMWSRTTCVLRISPLKSMKPVFCWFNQFNPNFSRFVLSKLPHLAKKTLKQYQTI